MNNSLLLLFVLAVARLAAGAVKCDDTHECPTGSTCCRSASGQWGCCPLPKAVCCSDHVHCCPNGYTCDTSIGKCNKGALTLPWLHKTPTIVSSTSDASSSLRWESEKAEAVKCDSTHECPTGNTCCKGVSGQWACCPAPKAVCCEDNIHCCPNGYKCQTSTGHCVPDLITLPWLRKPTTTLVKIRPQKPEEVDADVKCDSAHSCPSGNTCCKTASGDWGCCPIPQAVCCDDHLHCCPNGYRCRTSAGECVKGALTLPWLNKRTDLVKTHSLQTKVETVKCDDSHECPSGSTCCMLASGQWGCCPLPQAVCCQDKVHCCPNGYICDTSLGKCSKGALTLPWLHKTPAIFSIPQQKKVETVKCDDTHECPSGNTCCKTASGQWGCCPLPQAVCCSDKVHCCPNGYTCDTPSGKCNKGALTLPWLHKTPTLLRP